ncbi:nucleotidyltransferase domain-containing protein [Haloglomus litoreum]|uniref:nucleotidyltransferase domain-containing protein n=1 Tax=Haloglomus litoreum TaxID=3034026 RepID=UPI0023E89669|nr:nucleotidyltransferase domain-containing protein [Haloglomus sp. DT116]
MSGALDGHERAVEELRERLGSADIPGLDRLILFGSVARRDHQPDSDVDALAVLADDAPGETGERVRDIAYDVMLETGTVVSVQVVHAGTFAERSDHPFFRRVRSEGTALYG